MPGNYKDKVIFVQIYLLSAGCDGLGPMLQSLL